MKKLLLLLTVLSVFMTVSCDDSDDEPAYVTPNLSVSNIVFDSLSYSFTADTNAVDGTKITLTCNEMSDTVVAKDGKISLTYGVPFYKGIRGGKSYSVSFSAEGYNPVSGSIQYWPKVVCYARSKDKVNVFCGGNSNFVTPTVQLINYDEDKVSIKQEFKTFTDSEGQNASTDDTTSWTVADTKTFLTSKTNVGKSVVVTTVVTPSNGNENLREKVSVLYRCKNEEMVSYIQIVRDCERYEACLYKENSDNNAESAGGNVSFQWQVKKDDESFADIDGATEKIFTLTEQNVDTYEGKYLRIKIVQKFENESQEDSILHSDAQLVFHTIKETQVYYDGIIDQGDDFDVKKVRGKVSDELGNWHDIKSGDVSLFEDEAYLEIYSRVAASKTFDVLLDNSGFIMSTFGVFATVRQVLKSEDIPRLKTATNSVALGSAEFESRNADLEISYDGGATYTAFPENEFTVPEDKTLYVRKKASGTPNTEDYLKESEPCTVIVSDENIGKKTTGGSIVNGISMPQLSLSKENDNGKVRIKATLDIPDPQNYKYGYVWCLDDKPIGEYSSSVVYYDDNGATLVVDPSKLGPDTYQVYCSVSITDRSTSYNFVTVSAQIPLVVN